jgi:benzoyl-CoA reductase/2-hydroxyglutaryl-CoA dehydratase subunit BcrC/BadD/HgdB
MPSHYAEQEEQIYLKSHLHDLEIKKNGLLEEIKKNDMTQREVKDKIDVYNREPKSRYKQLNFWEDVG